MRKVIYITLLTLILVSCGRKEKANYNKDNGDKRIEITPFFVNVMYLQDDKKNLNVDPQQFLSPPQLAVLQNCIKSFLQNTPSKIITDPNWEPQDKKDLLAKISDFKNFSRVDFYESWYFNRESNMIEKEMLGYAVFSYIPKYEAYRDDYYIFKDDAALQKAKKYYFAH